MSKAFFKLIKRKGKNGHQGMHYSFRRRVPSDNPGADPLGEGAAVISARRRVLQAAIHVSNSSTLPLLTLTFPPSIDAYQKLWPIMELHYPSLSQCFSDEYRICIRTILISNSEPSNPAQQRFRQSTVLFHSGTGWHIRTSRGGRRVSVCWPISIVSRHYQPEFRVEPSPATATPAYQSRGHCRHGQRRHTCQLRTSCIVLVGCTESCSTTSFPCIKAYIAQRHSVG